MKSTKAKSVWTILIFLLLCAGGVYMGIMGVGKNHSGKIENIPLGLDLQGGLSVTYEITTPSPTNEEIDATIDKLQRRVDEYSKEGEVYREGDNRITVEIPVDTSKYDAHQILDELGQPGQLEFLDEDNEKKREAGETYEVILNGADVKDAQPGVDDSGVTKDYVVQLAFTDEGAKKFGDGTTANVDKRIYIIYDNQIASAPKVNEPILNGNAVINGMEDYDAADRLASTIRIGALPLELKQIQYNIVGAKLGREAVSTSLQAGAIGLGIVALIMIVIYLLPGFVSALALAAYVLLMLLILSVRHVTLTLPGIAGILLSIGMAVDANVIIFTRIKEELAKDLGVRNAVENGFSKAFSAILDGNITTLIATVVLMLLGSGSIKGFAITLMIGIILSMFTALVVTKLLLTSLVNLGATSEKLYGKAKQPKVPHYCKNFKWFGLVSIVIIVAGFAWLGVNKSTKDNTLNYALEFTGGTSATVTFEESYDLARAEAEIAPVIADTLGINASVIQIQTVEGSNQVIFKMPELTEEQSGELDKALAEKFKVSETSFQSISSTISNEMRRDAIIAVIIASILMLIYIAIRFSDVKFGVSAVLALLHDVFVVFAVYSIGFLSVGNTFIACMLTILGYSINATIIIFDRVRENMRNMDPKEELENVVDKSIAQTFTRTIYTSLTTLVMILMLFILGVSSLKEFTLTLMAGVICGGYSSVCISAPLWYTLKKKFTKSDKKTA